MSIIKGRATAVRATAAMLSLGTIEIRSLAGELARAAAHDRVPPAGELAATSARIRMIADVLHGFPLLPTRARLLGRERVARQELVRRWGVSAPEGREWIVAALAEAGPQFGGYPQMLEHEWQRWLTRNPPQREQEPIEATGPAGEWREEQVALVDAADTVVAVDAVLELTRREPDGEWMTRLLLDIVGSDRPDELRAMAVTCLGHTARRHHAIDREAVLPVLRRLLDDPALRVRAQESIDVIERYGPGTTPG